MSRIMCISTSHEPTKLSIEQLQDRGNTYYTGKLYKEALEIYTTLLIQTPRDPAVWNDKGLASKHLGFYDAALKAFNIALNIDKQKKELWFNKGCVHMLLKQYERASFCFEVAIRIDANYSIAWLQMADAYNFNGDYLRAFFAYLKTLSFSNYLQDETIWYNLGIALHQLHYHEEAMQCYDHVLTLNTNFKDAWFNKGLILLHQNHLEAAVDCFRTATKLDPSDKQAKEELEATLKKVEANAKKNVLPPQNGVISMHVHTIPHEHIPEWAPSSSSIKKISAIELLHKLKAICTNLKAPIANNSKQESESHSTATTTGVSLK